VPINRIRLDDVDIRNITTTTTLLNETLSDLSDRVDENFNTIASTKANIVSPNLLGVPTSTNAPADTNTTQIATTAFVVGQGYLKSTTAQSTYAPLANPTLTGTVTAGSVLITNEVLENSNIIGSAIPSSANIDLITSGIHFYTVNSTANWTFNFRADSSTSLNAYMATGQVVTATILVTNGSTPFRATGFQIDGASITPRWADAVAPSAGNANSTDIYTFTIIKTGNGIFTTLASLARFA
jgi:hypothetical protein